MFILWGAVLLAGSCIKEDMKPAVPEGETEVTIAISVPGPVAAATRGLTATEEDRVGTIELLVFDTSDKFLYVSNARDITADNNVRNFQAVLKTGTVKITMLANCREIINDIYPTGIPEGTARQTVIDALVLSASAAGWITDPADPEYRDIPMWGDVPGTVTIDLTTTSLQTGGTNIFDIHRMVAKVDVTTSLDPSAFTLTSVRLYYYTDKGSLIPGTAYDPSNPSPYLPYGTAKTKGPLVYDGTKLTDTGNGVMACLDEIYMFESGAGSRGAHPANTCLVVGGNYKGIPGFYRIDFQKTTVQGNDYLDINRNHHYQVVITDVRDIGFPDPDEALEAFPVDLDSQIIDWNEDNTDDVAIEGGYVLKLSTDELVFNPGLGTQVVYIYTDHPDGWKLDTGSLPAWISAVSPATGPAGDYTPVTVTVEEHDGMSLRFVEIPVIVANLSKDIMVMQRGLSDVDLEVYASPNPLLLGKYMTTDSPATLTISTYPAGIPLYFEYSGEIQWKTGYGVPPDGTTDRTFEFIALPNTSGSVTFGYLTVYVKNSAGSIASAIVEIQQVDKIAGLEADLDAMYDPYPGEYEFRVNSTVPWQVNYVADGSAWQPSFGMTLQPATSSWETKKFTFSGNPLYQNREVEVSLYAPESREFETLIFNQSYLPPTIDPVEGTSLYVPSASGETSKFKFKTNADWQITTDNNWSSMIRAQVSPQSVTDIGTAYLMDEYEIEFTTTDYAYNGTTPKAGMTTLSGFTLRLMNHTPHSGTVSQYFTVRRIVPPMIRLSSSGIRSYCPLENNSTLYVGGYNPTSSSYLSLLSSGEQDLALHFDTNVDYEIWTSLNPSEVFTHTVSGSVMETNQISPRMRIPANETGSNRDITVYVRVAGTTEVLEFPLEQKGWNVSAELNSPVSGVLSTGGPQFNITFKDPDGQITGTTPLVFAFIVDGKEFIMEPGTGTAGGNVPAMYKTSVAGGSAVYEIPLAFNPGEKARDVQLIYGIRTSGGTTLNAYQALYAFHRIGPVFEQDWKIQELSAGLGGYKIARGNIPDVTGNYAQNGRINWTNALGIAETYLTTLRFTDPAEYYTYDVLTGSSKVVVSCASHTEPDYPDMEWRVPTLDELKEMFENRDIIGGFNGGSTNVSSVNYWAINEVSATNAYMVNFLESTFVPITEATKTSGLVANYPGHLGIVRCVSRTP